MYRTCDYIELNAHYCVLFSSKVRIRVAITFSVWLVSNYAHVFALLSVVIVTLPLDHHRESDNDNGKVAKTMRQHCVVRISLDN